MAYRRNEKVRDEIRGMAVLRDDRGKQKSLPPDEVISLTQLMWLTNGRSDARKLNPIWLRAR